MTSTANRSLSPAGRIVCLLLIGCNTLMVAVAAAVLGAWPALPFAGLEIVAVAYAFHRIGEGDGDYERLTIGDFDLRFEARRRGAVSRFECNRFFAQVVCRRRRGGRCELALRSSGRQVPIGRLLNDDERLAWVSDLKRRLKIVND